MHFSDNAKDRNVPVFRAFHLFFLACGKKENYDLNLLIFRYPSRTPGHLKHTRLRNIFFPCWCFNHFRLDLIMTCNLTILQCFNIQWGFDHNDGTLLPKMDLLQCLRCSEGDWVQKIFEMLFPPSWNLASLWSETPVAVWALLLTKHIRHTGWMVKRAHSHRCISKHKNTRVLHECG